LRIDRKHSSKRMFGFVKVAALQRCFTPLKKLLRIDALRGRRRAWFLRLSLLHPIRIGRSR
jgi:hypothetical protein